MCSCRGEGSEAALNIEIEAIPLIVGSFFVFVGFRGMWCGGGGLPLTTTAREAPFVRGVVAVVKRFDPLFALAFAEFVRVGSLEEVGRQLC